MAATRYCGKLRIVIAYRDDSRQDYYDCRVSVDRARGGKVLRFPVMPPAAGFGPGIAYDSSEAFDRTAAAAVSFAANDEPAVEFFAAYGDDGPLITRKRPPAQEA